MTINEKISLLENRINELEKKIDCLEGNYCDLKNEVLELRSDLKEILSINKLQTEKLDSLLDRFVENNFQQGKWYQGFIFKIIGGSSFGGLIIWIVVKLLGG
jgi:predicted nuclease with TOPRIM domain